MLGRTRAALLPLLLVLAASPAWAVKEWYDYYYDARDRLIPSKQYSEALQSLQEAIRLRRSPGLNVQTYGLQFLDYLPYYQMGVCYLRTGDFNSAIRMFNIEEKSVAVTRSDLYKDLLRLRSEAEDGERQRVARLAREEVQRLLREASELAKTRKFGEALARLAQAQAAAAALDPATLRQIGDMITKTRAEEKEVADATARTQRIEQGLAEAHRLLDGQPTEALVRFDEVLALDPKNGAAGDGKREAQERILASTTRQARELALKEGRALFEAGQYQEALRPLTDAAADPSNAEARSYLEKARHVLEGLRVQKELAQKIDGLLSEGERLLSRGQYPEAQVKFESVLELDPGNVRAQSRKDIAERKTGEGILSRWLPNRGPELLFFEPAQAETQVDGPTVSVVGVATDDRRVASVEFRVGGRVVATLDATPTLLDSGESERTLPFQREFPLEPGSNDITVTAKDSSGERRMQSFHVLRRLRFYETHAFLPSALGSAVALIGVGVAVQQARRRRAVRNRFNPYIAGAPVMDDDMFFGRQKLMARMLNVLHHNSLMITGERRIGKTTFLYHLKRILESDDETEYRFFPVFTDLQGVPEDGFFTALMADLVDGLRLTPATLAAVRFRGEAGSYDGRDFSHDLQRVIEELKTRTPKKVKLALLIDEVDVLNEYSERVNQRLRGIFMKTFSEHLVAIMSGVGIKRIWKSEGSPWYNFFDEIELGGFSREEAEELIRRPVEGIFRYDPEAVEAILAYSQLKPYVIQKFCIHVVNRILEQKRTTVRASDVEAVREVVQLEGHEVPRDYVEGEPAPETVAD
jgi:tetratricopeptide (TPR) repeat protein